LEFCTQKLTECNIISYQTDFKLKQRVIISQPHSYFSILYSFDKFFTKRIFKFDM